MFLVSLSHAHMSDAFLSITLKPLTLSTILYSKLPKLPIPSNILLWIFHFLTDRMQAVSSLGLVTCYSKHHSRV